MKYAYLSLGMIAFGIVGLVFTVLFENVTINNESEYYVLHEAVEAAMYESIDYDYYRESRGIDVKIIEEKFIANCARRFYNSINGIGKGYTLTFYDIMESPPKVSVVASSSTDSYSAVGLGDEEGFNIKNALSAIFEYENVYGVVHYVNSEKCKNVSKGVLVGKPYGTLCVPEEKEGYQLKNGWSLSNDCTGPFVNSSTIVTKENFEKPLYACYGANQYTVTFNANGGSVSPSSMNVTYGEIYGRLPTPTLNGYTSSGWYTSCSGGNLITDATVYTSTSPITLCAHWTPARYTISYNLNGGVEDSNPGYYDINTASFKLNNPVRNGYLFTGWTGSNGATPQTDVRILKGSSGNKSYTANWSKQCKLTLKKNSNISSVSVSVGNNKYNNGGTFNCNQSVTINAVANDFYHFESWYNGNSFVSKNSSYTFNLSNDMEFTANASSTANQIILHYCWHKDVVAKTGYDDKTRKYTSDVITVQDPNKDNYRCDKNIKTFTYGTYSSYVIRNMGCAGGTYCLKKNGRIGKNVWAVDSYDSGREISVNFDNAGSGSDDVTNWNSFNSAFFSKLNTSQQNSFKTNATTDIYIYPIGYK